MLRMMLVASLFVLVAALLFMALLPATILHLADYMSTQHVQNVPEALFLIPCALIAGSVAVLITGSAFMVVFGVIRRFNERRTWKIPLPSPSPRTARR